MTKYVIQKSVKSITSDSRKVQAGSLFVAYPGDNSDGRMYIDDAIKNGAVAILWDPKDFSWRPHWKIENTPIKNLRQHVGTIADQFYGKPSNKLWCIGVTGTNGKTSITQWLSQCFNFISRKTAVIGTLGNGLPNQLTPTQNTTPDAVLLQSMLSDYLKANVEIVAMEVSSHGLDQGRVNGVHFDVAVLSNLTRDHLDYHGSYEKYAAAKRRLFVSNHLKLAVLNADDAFGKSIEQELTQLGIATMTYGIESGDIRASKIMFEHKHFSFWVTTPHGQGEVKANLLGKFNVYNVLAVLATLLVSKVSLADAIKAISQIESAGGRMQQLGGGDAPLVVVDYAHTPDALKNVLSTLKTHTNAKLICVFGCGGNRDVGKRVLMGEVASAHADAVVVTSDNPRNENPLNIMQDILGGMHGNYAVEEDRAKAIAMAISTAKPGDTVLIAGKGHEEYQEIAGEKRTFSDVAHAQKALKRYSGEVL
ncbi:MAG: UDP-N-acetylmuramoyl-L-alanyl-D-glutamate--2,6-diaminopimelate ligase [Methylophilaceae bacterium]